MNKRIAVVTGGMGGIGQAICLALQHKGMEVIACYARPKAAAETWQAEQKKTGHDFKIMPLNVTDYDQCESAIKTIEESYGPIDTLVNNAGITSDAPCCRMEKTCWDKVIAVDLSGVFYVTRAVLNYMRERKYGRIINISSINGQKGQYGQVNYAAAKAGIHGFTKALALEVAKKGITVNTISPGYITTDMIMVLPDEVRSKILNEIPMGRFGEPAEVARVVAFLADKDNSYITGANIAINGGHYMI